jgi:hypothetical protein
MRVAATIVAGLLAVVVAGLAGLVTHQRNELRLAAEAANKANAERALLGARIQELERRLLMPTESLSQRSASLGISNVPESGSAIDSDPLVAQAIEQERLFAAAVLNDPKRREAMLGQNRLIARMQHGEIIKRLELAPEKIDALIEILAQRQLANFGRGGLAAGEDPIATQHRLEELNETESAEIAKLLGSEKAARFAALRATLGARAMLLPVVQDLDLARIPLSPDQHDALAALLHEQTEALHAEQPLPDSPADLAGSTQEQMTARATHLRERQAELNRRLLERAADTLTPAQHQRLARYLQQQLELESLSFSGPSS